MSWLDERHDREGLLSGPIDPFYKFSSFAGLQERKMFKNWSIRYLNYGINLGSGNTVYLNQVRINSLSKFLINV